MNEAVIVIRRVRSFFFLLLLCSGLRAADSTELFFVFLDPKPGRPSLELLEMDSLKAFQAAHLVSMDQLYREKKLAVTGPFVDTIGGEIFIMRASTPEEVEALLQTNPLVKANRFTITVSPFTIIAGDICEPPELYDLEKYPFAHFKENKGCNNQQRAEQVAYYQEMVKQKKVLFAARMEKDHTVVVVFAQNDLLASAFHLVKNDPAVRAAAMRYTVRPWMTSAGAFCDFTQ